MTKPLKNLIGLCVCYDTPNFGSQLQVLATIKTIEKLGYSTEIIRYKKTLSVTLIAQSIPRLLNPYFVRSKVSSFLNHRKLCHENQIESNISIRENRFKQFAINNFSKNYSELYCGWNELVNESSRKYNTILVGSDQLWLPSNLGSHFYTLEFAQIDINKVSYATSFGVSEIPWFQKKSTGKYLNRINHLSTREINGERIIKELTRRDAEVVCDPTLLLTGKEWMNTISDSDILGENYIFCYFLGGNIAHRKAAEELSSKTGLKIVTCPFLDNYFEYDRNFGDTKLFDIDAGDFVNIIRHATYVLTDSFHGSIFSIIHHKKFITFNRFATSSNSRNSRIDSLFKLLNLEERRYNGDIMQITKSIDYSSVDTLVSELRNKSMQFLASSLEESDSND